MQVCEHTTQNMLWLLVLWIIHASCPHH